MKLKHIKGYLKYLKRLEEQEALSDSLDELVLCPKCQRGDIWQEAINRAEYVYNCDELVKGQEVIDYILAEVSVMLEQAENDADESFERS